MLRIIEISCTLTTNTGSWASGKGIQDSKVRHVKPRKGFYEVLSMLKPGYNQ